MKKTSFEYLGFTFTPVRKFTKAEEEKKLTFNYHSIGISNYEDMPLQTYRSSKWSWDEFYEIAKKHGGGEIDIFLIDGKAEVVPCSNELFALSKDEARKFPRKFKVEVCRTSYAFHTIEVDAISESEAEELALDQAGDYEFSEKSADYTIAN